MIDTEKQIIYQAYGFKITSEIPLPELPQLNHAQGLPDVVIERRDLTQLWAELCIPDKRFVVKEDFVMFQIADVAIFSIEEGKIISVSPMEGADEDVIRLYLLGTCMSSVLMQRRVLPLHGSAIVMEGKAYAIIGDSGAGKSTLATALLQKGYQLLTDDVIGVSMSSGQMPVVLPAFAQQKLWEESLCHFGMNSEVYRPIYEREKKFVVPVSSQFASKPYPLAGIFVLDRTDQQEIGVHAVTGLERWQMLYHHTFRQFLVPKLGLMEWHFQFISEMLKHIDMYHITRPVSRFTTKDLVSSLLHYIQKEK